MNKLLFNKSEVDKIIAEKDSEISRLSSLLEEKDTWYKPEDKLPDYNVDVLVQYHPRAQMSFQFIVTKRIDTKGTALEHRHNPGLDAYNFRVSGPVQRWQYITPPKPAQQGNQE